MIKYWGYPNFLRGGNANNGANSGLFTLNLNRNATNQNNNVGFRCVRVIFLTFIVIYGNKSRLDEFKDYRIVSCSAKGQSVYKQIRIFFSITNLFFLEFSQIMKFLSKENLLKAYKNAYKKRKNKIEVYIFSLDLEKNLNSILNDLHNKKFVHGKYRKLIINDSKKRFIHSPQLRDHIVHHMLYNVLYPVLDKKIPYNSFATRLGKGNHIGLKYFQKKLFTIVSGEDDLYYMKIDISKYFYSIPHDLLKEKIFKSIKNKDLVYAVNTVIDSYKTTDLFDNLFDKNSYYRTIKNKGLPIGAIHSQLFANFYMYDLDCFANQQIKPKLYMRYMDDLIFVDKKNKLLDYKNYLLNYIQNMKLQVHYKKVQINKLFFGINLLGYKIKVDKGLVITTVNKKNKIKYWKMMDNINKIKLNILKPNEINRIISMIESRKSMFIHTKYYQNYLGISG